MKFLLFFAIFFGLLQKMNFEFSRQFLCFLRLQFTLKSCPLSGSCSIGWDFVSYAYGGISINFTGSRSSNTFCCGRMLPVLHRRICCCRKRINRCWFRSTCRHKCYFIVCPNEKKKEKNKTNKISLKEQRRKLHNFFFNKNDECMFLSSFFLLLGECVSLFFNWFQFSQIDKQLQRLVHIFLRLISRHVQGHRQQGKKKQHKLNKIFTCCYRFEGLAYFNFAIFFLFLSWNSQKIYDSLSSNDNVQTLIGSVILIFG